MKSTYIKKILSSDNFVEKAIGYLIKNPVKILQVSDIRSFLSSLSTNNKISNGEVKTINSDSAIIGTVEHNYNGLKNLAGFDRGSILVNTFLSLYREILPEEARFLSIGPRNECELYSIISHGINPEQIYGIDLISSDPFVISGDMHQMPFEDNYFDTIFVGWVLAYSDDLAKACAEIVRVAKNGAYIIIGCDFNGSQYTDKGVLDEKYGTFNNVDDIFNLFGELVGEKIIQRNARFPYNDAERKIVAGFKLNK
jgi:SAM-dependent methyltransferase